MNKQKIILMLSLTVFIISGFFYMRYIWTSNINKTSEEAIQTAVVLQKALDGEMLKKLRGIPADADTIEYTSIEKRLIEIKKVSAAARYIYFYTKREGKLYFIADSEPVDSANSSPPGQEYTEADIQYYKPFESGESLITRPSTDRWGTWVSILVPVKNHITGKTTAVFAMDYPAENWDNAAIFQTAQSGVVVLFLFLLIAAFYIIIQKNLIMKEEQNQKETLIKSLRASENRLSTMFESHSSIMLLVDPENGELINANPTACKFYGYSADQLRSMRITDLNMLSVEEIKRVMREAVQHNRNYFIFPHRLSSGEIRTVEIHSSPVIIDEKPLLFSIIHDITERQKIEHDLRESENLQSLLLANLPAGVVIIDPATRIIEMVNNHVSVLFGATADQMVGRRCHSFLCPACEEKCPVADLGLTVDNADRVMLRSDGSPLPILKTVTKIKLNGQDKFLECFIDISDRKKIEEKLSASKHEADDLREKAEAASRSKSEFLASMSHEIRTPMNGVISMTGLLLGTPLTGEQKRFAGIIRSSGEALLSIINDILDFSKIEAYKLDLETVEFNLTKTVGETIELMEIKAEEKGLSLDFTIDEDVPEYLRGDSGRLRQILLNLLSNAIKFTASGSVKLGVVQEEDIGSWVRLCFTVTDTGIGIPADKLGKIFSPFTQADSSVTRKFGGTGLGLSISSNLVQLMGGR